MHLIDRTGPAGAAAVGVLLVNYEMQTPAMVDILGADVARAQAFVALGAFIAVACALPVLIVGGASSAIASLSVDRAKAGLPARPSGVARPVRRHRRRLHDEGRLSPSSTRITRNGAHSKGAPLGR